MLPRWCTDTVTVTRAPLVDSRGSKVRDWANASEHAVAGCSVQYSSSDTDFGDRAANAYGRWRIFAPPGADIQDGDRVSFGGSTFEVDGVTADRRSPTGACSHLQATLVEWKG